MSAGVIAAVILFLILSSYGGSQDNIQVVDGGAIYIGVKDLSQVSGLKYKVLILDSTDLSQEDVSVLSENSQLLLGYVNLGRVTGDKYRDLLFSMNITHRVMGDDVLVEYWSSEWMSLLIGELNHIYKLGFNGVLLDDVDIYSYLTGIDEDWVKGRDLYMDMRNLVMDIIKYCRDKYGEDFMIFLGFSNELSLLNDPSISNEINGILFKGLWHRLENNTVVKICECDVKHIFAALDEALNDGKYIIIADPVEDVSDAREFCDIARLRGYIPIPQPAENWRFDNIPPIEYYG